MIFIMMTQEMIISMTHEIESWEQFIQIESQKDYYKRLGEAVIADSKLHKICPKHKDLFTAFKLCYLHETKVVILGQDPYHGENQAHGLAFSVLPEVDIPPSLRNIYKEINASHNSNFKFPDGCLTHWALSGVLLLNTVLTVRQGQAGSHKGFGWEIFTDNAIGILNLQDRPIVFMLWGNFAKSKRKLLTNPKHLVLEAAHPSPLSAHNGFFGCNHFVLANEFLTKQGIDSIDWF